MYSTSTAQYTDQEINEQRKAIESFFSEFKMQFKALSTTNGLSFYFIFYNENKSVEVRFSDHPSNDRNKNYFNGRLCEMTFNRIGFELGMPGFSYSPIEFKTSTIEVMELKEGQKAISQRTTKNGNVLYSIEIKKPIKWGYTLNK